MGYILVVIAITGITYLIIGVARRGKSERHYLPPLFIAACAVTITVAVILFPEDAFEASLHGLDIWWNIVFPALLPFFILSQILIGLGVVHMMGVFLEPIMRPLFNVPGVGSFVLAMGLSSGFPLGAILTADMRRQKMVSKIEAERLISFVNTADPLFMFGAVAVGMFGYPAVGLTIALAHYLSTIVVGIMMRFYGKDPSPTTDTQNERGNIFKRSLKALIVARRKDGRQLGQLMGDAIRKSMNTQMIIGGFIILFSVMIRILDVIGIVELLSSMLSLVITPFGLDPTLARSLISGLFEIDLGCQVAGDPETFTTLNQKVIAASMIIAWSGLSVHAQVASIISDTDIDMKPFIITRVIHAILAGLFAALLIGPAEPVLGYINIPVFYSTVPSATISFWWQRTYIILQHVSLFICAIAALSLIIHLCRRLQLIILRVRH